MPSEIPSWVAEGGLVVSSVLVVLAVVNAIHNLNKDRGVHARRARVLEQAKTRTDFWKSRVEIQSKILAGKKLESAKDEAGEAIDRIHKETNANLIILSSRRSPLPVVGVPWWRKYLLLYDPAEGNRALWHCARVFYWLSLVPFVCCMYIPVLVIREYLSRSSGTGLQFWHDLFHSQNLQKSALAIIINLLSFVYWSAFFYRSARTERNWPRLKEVDQI